MERMLKIAKWGNAQGIRLPKAILNLLSLNLGDELAIDVSDDKIILSPIKKELKFEDLFANYEGETKQKEFWADTEIVGKEGI